MDACQLVKFYRENMEQGETSKEQGGGEHCHLHWEDMRFRQWVNHACQQEHCRQSQQRSGFYNTAAGVRGGAQRQWVTVKSGFQDIVWDLDCTGEWNIIMCFWKATDVTEWLLRWWKWDTRTMWKQESVRRTLQSVQHWWSSRNSLKHISCAGQEAARLRIHLKVECEGLTDVLDKCWQLHFSEEAHVNVLTFLITFIPCWLLMVKP